MLGQIVAQLIGTTIADKKRALRGLLLRGVFALIALLFILGAIAFGLVALYHVLTPFHATPAEAALIIGGGLLLIGVLLMAVAIYRRAAPPMPPAAAMPKLDGRSAELSAIEALAMLNSALTDIGKARGGTTPFLGLLGVAALVGFVSGRKR